MSDSTEKQKYKGNCHCGKVRYTLTLPPLETIDIVDCNCSICTKTARLLVYPDKTDVNFTQGEDTMSEYRCAGGTLPHKFCGTCGTPILTDVSSTSFFDGKLAFSIRTLENIEDVLDNLNYVKFDGKNKLEPKYTILRRCRAIASEESG